MYQIHGHLITCWNGYLTWVLEAALRLDEDLVWFYFLLSLSLRWNNFTEGINTSGWVPPIFSDSQAGCPSLFYFNLRKPSIAWTYWLAGKVTCLGKARMPFVNITPLHMLASACCIIYNESRITRKRKMEICMIAMHTWQLEFNA